MKVSEEVIRDFHFELTEEEMLDLMEGTILVKMYENCDGERVRFCLNCPNYEQARVIYDAQRAKRAMGVNRQLGV